jgi:hypothetical protein
MHVLRGLKLEGSPEGLVQRKAANLFSEENMDFDCQSTKDASL